MNLKEYLKPMVDIYGIGSIAKILDISTNSVYNWFGKGLPRTEHTGETKHRERLAELARVHESTKHITVRSLARYINNPKGEKK